MARVDQVFHLDEAVEKSLAFARAVRSHGQLHISGCTSLDGGAVIGIGDMNVQLRTIYDKLDQILSHHNLTKEHVIKEVIYTTNMASLNSASHVRASIYKDIAPPAVTGVEVSGLIHPDILVEIEFIAETPT